METSALAKASVPRGPPGLSPFSTSCAPKKLVPVLGMIAPRLVTTPKKSPPAVGVKLGVKARLSLAAPSKSCANTQVAGAITSSSVTVRSSVAGVPTVAVVGFCRLKVNC